MWFGVIKAKWSLLKFKFLKQVPQNYWGFKYIFLIIQKGGSKVLRRAYKGSQTFNVTAMNQSELENKGSQKLSELSRVH